MKVEWFPHPLIESRNQGENEERKVEPVHKGGGIVHPESELFANKSTPEDEIYLETNPNGAIKQQNFRLVDAAAQHFSAQNLTALDYLDVESLLPSGRSLAR
jgi:hypothetical protein